ncbi:formyltransferase family protein [Flavobacteriaceae bacterium]|nr:formyltransferase family protein [Flavobacteriaceae bacterium]
MNIACITYRDWAIDIYEKINELYKDEHNFLIWKTKNEFDADKLKKFKPDLILWYGWSWIVEDAFVNDYESIMLHPTPLPKYRGGSPIQNQIINGETIGAVSLFRMTEGLDKGDIYQQLTLSLTGTLNEIFRRISDLGFAATCNIIEGNYTLTPQDDSKSTYYKRRSPEDSEITQHELQNSSAEYLNNKIRMLNDPYPNAYIKTADGKKLFIIESKLNSNEK